VREFWREFRENRIAVLALFIVVLVVLAAVFAPLVAPQDPYDLASLELRDARKPPGFVGSNGYAHLLGTDAQGRRMATPFATQDSSMLATLARAEALILRAPHAPALAAGGEVEAILLGDLGI